MQEDLDWQCYWLYGLIDDDIVMGIQPPTEPRSILPGMRAFEVLLARDVAARKNPDRLVRAARYHALRKAA